MSVVEQELRTLAETTMTFQSKMFAKLASKAQKGWVEWDVEGWESEFRSALQEHVDKLVNGDVSQAVDVANFAMFLWHLGGRP